MTMMMAMGMPGGRFKNPIPAVTYYVDPAGSDANNGTSPATAWQTITKVNGATLRSGDTVAFKGGSSFSGNLVPQNGITYTSYGTGKATLTSTTGRGIDGTGKTGVVITSLILTGSLQAAEGIYFASTTTGNYLNGPTILNCDISNFGGSGIRITSGATKSGFRFPYVANCTVTACCSANMGASTAGIYFSSGASYGIGKYGPAHYDATLSNCVVSNCPGSPTYFANHSGNGILVAGMERGLVQYCVAANNGTNAAALPGACWMADCKDVVMQYCEAYGQGTLSDFDGAGFDIDGGAQNCVIQYCYSHGNKGAGLMMIAYDDDGLLTWQNNTIRYCVSVNDGASGGTTGDIVNVRIGSGSTGYNRGYFYNNTIISNRTNGALIRYDGFGDVNSIIANNVLYATNNINLLETDSNTFNPKVVGNCWYSASGSFSAKRGTSTYTSYAAMRSGTGWETIGGVDVGKNLDPLLVNPGAAVPTIGPPGWSASALPNYKLQAGSPMIGGAINLTSQYGLNVGLYDYWGDTVPQGAGFDIGADEYTSGGGGVPVNTVAPVISYDSAGGYIGSVYTATTGTWSNTPTGYTYQWRSNGVDIGGATSSTFTMTAALEGTAITCRVTASNGSGSGSPATSNTIEMWVPTDAGVSIDFWLDAQSASTITQSGGTVSAWNDRSPNARNATQATGALQPAYSATAVNGKPGISGNGALVAMALSSFPTNLIVYGNLNVDGTRQANMGTLIQDNTAGNYALFGNPGLDECVWTTTAQQMYSYGTPRASAAAAIATSGGFWCVNQLAGNGGGGFGRIHEGTALFNNNSGGSGTRGLNGAIGEYVIFTGTVSSTVREQMEGYLCWRWGLVANLNAGNTYKSAPPRIQ